MERAKSISARVRAVGGVAAGQITSIPTGATRRLDLLHDDRVALVARGVGGSLHEDAVAETAPDEGRARPRSSAVRWRTRGVSPRAAKSDRVCWLEGGASSRMRSRSTRSSRRTRRSRRRADRRRRAARGRAARTAARGGDCPGSACRRRTRHPPRRSPSAPPARRGSPRRSAGRRAGGRRRSRAAAAAGSSARGSGSSRS